jgi:hypothetical protein
MRNKKVLLIVLPVLLMACGCLAIAVASSSGDDDAANEGKTRVSSNIVGPVCQGTPLPDAPAYTQAAGARPLGVLELGRNGNYQYGFINPNVYRLPDGWTTGYVQDLELVVCVDQEVDELVEECDYTLNQGGGAVTLSRYSKRVTLRLLEAQTGREVAAETFTGMPRECRETEEFLEGASGSSIYGNVYQELEDWLRPFVEVRES